MYQNDTRNKSIQQPYLYIHQAHQLICQELQQVLCRVKSRLPTGYDGPPEHGYTWICQATDHEG